MLVRLSIFMHGIARLVDDVDRWATEEGGGIDMCVLRATLRAALFRLCVYFYLCLYLCLCVLGRG